MSKKKRATHAPPPSPSPNLAGKNELTRSVDDTEKAPVIPEPFQIEGGRGGGQPAHLCSQQKASLWIVLHLRAGLECLHGVWSL